MSFKKFGTLIEEAPPKDFPKFGEPVETVSSFQSKTSSPIKGFLKGVTEQISSFPLIPKGPIPLKGQHALLEKHLPTNPEDEPLERVGRVGSYALGPGKVGQKALQIGIGTAAGETAKKLGAPEWLERLLETSGMFSPNLSKQIPLKKSQELLGNFARKQGLTDNEISPLIQSPQQLDRWATLAKRGAKTHDLLNSIYEKTGTAYQEISKRAESLPALEGNNLNEFLGNLQTTLEKVRPRFKRLIKDDLNDLLNSEMKFNDIKEFIHDVNATTKGVEGGKAVLNLLKEPSQKALNKISPELSEDFNLTQKLYRTRANVAAHLKPSQTEALLNAGEIYDLSSGIAQGDLGILKRVLGVIGGRLLAREMLINPKLQNISRRMLVNLSANKTGAALKLMNEFKDQLQQTNPELGRRIIHAIEAKAPEQKE